MPRHMGVLTIARWATCPRTPLLPYLYPQKNTHQFHKVQQYNRRHLLYRVQQDPQAGTVSLIASFPSAHWRPFLKMDPRRTPCMFSCKLAVQPFVQDKGMPANGLIVHTSPDGNPPFSHLCRWGRESGSRQAKKTFFEGCMQPRPNSMEHKHLQGGTHIALPIRQQHRCSPLAFTQQQQHHKPCWCI